MSKHLQLEPSEIVQWYLFHTRVRQPQESVATYVAELKRIAEHCNFGDNDRLNEMIRDRLVCGITNDKWKQRLLAEDKKLNFVIAYAQPGSLRKPGESSPNQVHQLRPSRPSSTPLQAKRDPHRARDKRPCYRCCGEHNPDNCRFKTVECRWCHRKGHIASLCRKKQRASRGTATHNVVEQGDDPVDKLLTVSLLRTLTSSP